MQKAGEPENDAGFPKHNYSQLVIHTPLSLDYRGFFRLHIYGISKWLHTAATVRVKARAPTCTPRALVMYYAPIYIAYMH